MQMDVNLKATQITVNPFNRTTAAPYIQYAKNVRQWEHDTTRRDKISNNIWKRTLKKVIQDLVTINDDHPKELNIT